MDHTHKKSERRRYQVRFVIRRCGSVSTLSTYSDFFSYPYISRATVYLITQLEKMEQEIIRKGLRGLMSRRRTPSLHSWQK